jgi:hypothetical protein
MSESNREQLLALALGVLPELPGSVDVLSAAGGGLTVTLSHQEGDLLHGFVPAGTVSPDLQLLARVLDQSRGRYEVEFLVADAFFHTAAETLVHLEVTSVTRRKARRASPRVTVSVPLVARMLYGRTLARDAELEVRLVDVSATGLAFVSQRELSAGDLLRLVFPLGGRRLKVEARVVRMDPAPYGRHRIGCEITEIGDLDRRTIAQVAEEAEAAGSEQERRPERLAAWAEARERRSVERRTSDRPA